MLIVFANDAKHVSCHLYLPLKSPAFTVVFCEFCISQYFEETIKDLFILIQLFIHIRVIAASFSTCMYVRIYLKTLALSAICWFPQRASSNLAIFNEGKETRSYLHVIFL